MPPKKSHQIVQKVLKKLSIKLRVKSTPKIVILGIDDFFF